MNNTDLIELYDLMDNDLYELAQALEAMGNNEADFEYNNHRFIHNADIAEIIEEELGNDDYILGCFKASFLSEVLGIDTEVIAAMQEAEAYEAIGKLVKDLDKLSDLACEYIRYDGYGHHFNHYDGTEIELGDYHIFRVN